MGFFSSILNKRLYGAQYEKAVQAGLGVSLLIVLVGLPASLNAVKDYKHKNAPRVPCQNGVYIVEEGNRRYEQRRLAKAAAKLQGQGKSVEPVEV